jgi:hypothetical protein
MAGTYRYQRTINYANLRQSTTVTCKNLRSSSWDLKLSWWVNAIIPSWAVRMFQHGMNGRKSIPFWHSRLFKKYIPLNFSGMCQVNAQLHYEMLQRSREDTVVAVCCCLSDSAMALANMWSSSTCCCLSLIVPFGWLLQESWSERANACAKASSSLCGNYYTKY